MNRGWISGEREEPPATPARVVVDGAGLALAYLVAGVLGASLTVGSLPLVLPAAGVALAGLVLLGLGLWPVVWGVATLVELVQGAPLGLAVVGGGGSALGAALGVLLLRGARFQPGLDRARDVTALVILGAAAGPAASTLVSSAAWAMLGGPDVEGLGARALGRALGEAVGILVVAPALLGLARRGFREEARRTWPIEVFVGSALAMTLAVLLFGGRLPGGVASAALLLPLPLLLWGVFRFGLVGASGVVALFVLVGAWRTAAGTGPFAAAEALGGISSFWAYAATLALAALLLSALLAEQRGSLALLQGVFDGPSEGILVVGGGGLVVRANAAAGRLFGLRGGEGVVGTPLTELFPPAQPDDTPSSEAFRRHARDAEHARGHGFPFVWRRQDGSTFDADVALSPLPVDGELGSLVVLRDATAERAREESLRRAREDALQASVSKTQYVTGVSHAIRSSLTSNLGFSRLLTLDESLPRRARDHAERIHRSGLNILRLVGEILETAKVEIGRLGLAPSSFELRPLLLEVEALFRGRATEKGLDLVVRTDPEVPSVVRTDQGKIRQILVNVVGNAVKFTSEGSVTVTVEGSPDAAQPPGWELRFTVADTGPGIRAEEMERVFRPGEGGQPPPVHTVLGLPGSVELARVLGGSLTATSREGHGSTLVLTVPVTAASQADRSDGDLRVVGLAAGEAPRRILVVDDLEENRTVLSALLARVGFEVRQASDGSEALQAFGAWMPHLLVMNRQMPIMDGHEATRRIKVTEEGRRTPVLMVTAGGFEDELEEMLRAGADGVLRLPVSEADLLGEVARHLGVHYVYEERGGS